MPVLSAGNTVTFPLPAGQAAIINGFGLAQVVPPIPQGIPREPIVLIGGRRTTFGPFPVPVSIFVAATSSPVEYFGTVPSEPPPQPGQEAYVVRLPSLATLQALAVANALDVAAIYVDTATGQKYWALAADVFVSAGLNLDAFNLSYVVNGLLPPASGPIAGAQLSAGVAFVDGSRVSLLATPLPLTATRDNYVDLRRDGTVLVTPVTVAAASPPIPANSMRLGFCRTDATAVTARTIDGFDTLGNTIYNTVEVPLCRVSREAATGYGGAAIVLEFPDADLFDNANFHSPTINNSRFTFPANGVYHVDCSILWFAPVTPTSAYTLGPRLDGVTTVAGFPEGFQGTQATQTMRCSGPVVARAGQYLEMVYTPNGASGAFDRSRVSICKVGRS